MKNAVLAFINRPLVQDITLAVGVVGMFLVLGFFSREFALDVQASFFA
jgi:hypothetical protein